MKIVKRIFIFLFVVILLLVIFIAALPTIISTEWGKSNVEAMLNKGIPGKIVIKSIKINWGHGQSLEGVELKDPDGKLVADLEKFHTDASLWRLLWGSTHLGNTIIKDLNLSIVSDVDGQTNLQKALGMKSKEATLPPSTIHLSNVNAELSLNNGPISAHISGKTREESMEGSFKADLLLNQNMAASWDAFSEESKKLLTVEGSKEAVINVNVVNFPVDIIDRLINLKNPKLDSIFRRLLGDKLNLTVEKESNQEGLVFNLKATTPKLNGSFKGEFVKGLISLKEPGRFNLMLDAKTINSMLDDNMLESDTNISITLAELTVPLQFLEDEVVTDPCRLGFKLLAELSPTSIKGTKINSLTATLDGTKCSKDLIIAFKGKAEKDKEPYSIDITLKGKKPTSLEDLKKLAERTLSGEVFAETPKGKFLLKDLKLENEGSSKKLSGTLSLLQKDGKTYPLLSSPTSFILQVDSEKYRLKLDGSSLNGKLEILINKNQQLNLQSADFTYNLTPEGIKEAGKMAGKELPDLQNTAKINLRVDPAKINLKDPLTELEVKGVVNIDKLDIKEDSQSVTLENLVIPYAVNNLLQTIGINLNGEAYTDPKEKHTKLNVRFSSERLFTDGNLNLKDSKFEIISELYSIPTSLISSFISKDLTPILGPVTDVELKTAIDMSNQSAGYWDMFIDSANLSAKARIKIEDSITLYQSTKPTASIKLTITPESYKYLKSMMSDKEVKAMTLAAPVVLEAFLTDLDIPIKNSQNWASQGKIKGEFTSSDISWKELPKLKPFTFNGSLDTSNLAEKIDFAVNGQSENSSLALNGALYRAFTAQGQMQKLDKIDVEGKLEAKQLPLSWFQAFLLDEKHQKQIRAVLGDPLDATASFHLNNMNGPVYAKLSGANGTAALDGKVNNGILTLTSPFQWQIKVTPQLGQDLLQTDMPLLSSIVSAEKPLIISISQNNFSCPIYPFDMNKIKIGEGKINFGKVTVRNEGDIRNVLSLIKTIPDNQFVLWFTPVYFNMDKSLLTLRRFDLLVANMYTLASWGTVDVTTNKMDLILGLSTQSLGYAFNIQGLDDDYLLQVPIKGRNGKVEVDKTKVTARITALIAQSQSNSNIKLLGSLVDKALSDGGAPKPTTQPLPWADQFTDQSKPNEQPKDNSNSSSSSSSNPKKKKKSDANTLIEQGANTLLNQIFK